MSRFLKVMIVMLAVAAMAVPATVFAADNLSLGGQMRLGGWYLDDGGDSTNTYAEQRLRIGGKFSVAEGVSVTFRTDFSEQSWGSNPSLGRTAWQLDRAHMDIDKGIFHLRAGQLYYGTGGQFAVDTETTGAVLDMNFGAVKAQVAYLLPDDNNTVANAYAADDTIVVLNVSHKTDMYSANVFVANAKNRSAAADFVETSAAKAQTADRDAEFTTAYDKAYAASLKADGSTVSDGAAYVTAVANAKAAGIVAGDAAVATWDADTANAIAEYSDSNNGYAISGEDVYVYGFGATFNLDAVTLETGLTLFSGDFLEGYNVDATGTQFNLKATMAASETVNVGGAFYYAKAADDDERQVTYVGNGFNGYDPTNYGSLENENLYAYANRVYDFTGSGSGVVGGQIFASAKASSDLTVYGSVAYLAPEDDANTGVDSDLALNVSMAYKIMDHVTMATQLQYVDRDDAANTDATTAIGTRLYVNF